MRLADTRASYGWISIAMHWIVAGFTIYLFVNGEQFAEMPRGPAAAALRGQHVAWGMVATAIVVVRIAWRWRQDTPAKSEQSPALNLLATLVQWGLTVALVVTCLTGIVNVWSGGQAINVFGLMLPTPMARSGVVHGAMERLHSIASHAMIPLVLLHVLGALKHAIVDRDNVLWRMMRPSR